MTIHNETLTILVGSIDFMAFLVNDFGPVRTEFKDTQCQRTIASAGSPFFASGCGKADLRRAHLESGLGLVGARSALRWTSLRAGCPIARARRGHLGNQRSRTRDPVGAPWSSHQLPIGAQRLRSTASV